MQGLEKFKESWQGIKWESVMIEQKKVWWLGKVVVTLQRET